jgi:hypothetical protein
VNGITYDGPPIHESRRDDETEVETVIDPSNY